MQDLSVTDPDANLPQAAQSLPGQYRIFPYSSKSRASAGGSHALPIQWPPSWYCLLHQLSLKTCNTKSLVAASLSPSLHVLIYSLVPSASTSSPAGVLLWSLGFIIEGKDLFGGLLFAVLVNMKQLYAVLGPAYFVYLLRNYCRYGFLGDPHLVMFVC